MRTVIMNGGNIEEDFALGFLKSEPYDYLLAADHGLDFLRQEGILPDEILGDFDSAAPGAKEYYQEKGIPIQVFPTRKDATDMELAMETAVRRGSSEILVLGATGTRMDHVLGSIYTLAIAADAGIPCALLDAHNRIRLVRDRLVIPKRNQYGRYVSLLPVGGAVEGLTLEGFSYPLKDACLKPLEGGLGISNEITGKEAVISLKKGNLLVIESRDDKKIVYPPLGIYFGDEEICASVYQEKSNHFSMVTIPTVYTVTARGEVLTGERMKMYMRSHESAKQFVFPVLRAIEERGGFRGTGMGWENYIVPVQKIVHALLGELRRKLAERDAVWGDARECVLACSTVSETCRDAMRELFAECGFDVKRILNSAVACAAAEMTEGQRGICCAVERERISVSQMVVEGEVWEVIHSEVYPFVPQPVNGDREAVEQKFRLFLSGEEAYEELEKMKLRLFLAPFARQAIGGQFQYPDLAAAAATGAAKQCAKLFCCGIGKNFLLLDVIETDLGLEFLNADGEVTLDLKWLVQRQTSIPTRKFYNESKIGYIPDCFTLPAGTRKLRLYMNRHGLKNYEIREFSLADVYGSVSRIPEKLHVWIEVSLEIGARRVISIGLRDPKDKKKKELFLFPFYKNVADAWWRFRETGQ